MKLRSIAARRFVAGLCIAAVLCIAISPVAFGLLCALPVPVFSSIEPASASAPLRAESLLPPAQGGLSATAARAPPLA